MRHRQRGMKTRRLPLLVVGLALALVACDAATDPSPSPSPEPVRVESADQAARLVAQRSPLLAGIPPLDPMMMGTAHFWRAEELSGRGDDAGWRIAFRAGWGDCQAGCISTHTWTYLVTVDGRVTFDGEEGEGLPPEVVEELRTAAAAREPVVGIAGRATAGPTCPVEQPGDPSCGPRSVPFATIVVRDASGAEVARVETDDAGFFRVALAPGAYTLEAQPVEGLMGTAAPAPVAFGAGAEAWVDLAYDTGIR